MSEQKETVYIKAEQNSICLNKEITLGDVATIFCTDQSIQSRLRTKHLYTFQQEELKHHKGRKIVSILKVYELILEDYPKVTIENLGEKDFVIEYPGENKGMIWWQWMKTIFTALAIFFGSAFTIMTFNNDVSVPTVFEKVYKLTMGEASSGFTPLEIFYSIGMAIGILVYFNHIGHKKITSDPTPIQVQMRKYEKDVDTTFIDESSRKGSNLDVS